MASKKVETKVVETAVETSVVEAKKTVPAGKKAPVKKKDPKASVVIEYSGKQVIAKDILDQAKKAFTKANQGVEINTVEVYVKPEENIAYYVVNGIGTDEYKIIL